MPPPRHSQIGGCDGRRNISRLVVYKTKKQGKQAGQECLVFPWQHKYKQGSDNAGFKKNDSALHFGCFFFWLSESGF